MAAKPKSIFVFAHTNHTWNFGDAQPTDIAAWEVELQGNESMENALKRVYANLPIGTELYMCGDHNVTKYTVTPTLTAD